MPELPSNVLYLNATSDDSVNRLLPTNALFVLMILLKFILAIANRFPIMAVEALSNALLAMFR